MYATASRRDQWVRFGVFTLNLHTGELQKRGLRIKLQSQPFRVLRALLDRPGELVTREELKRELWPDNTHVQFELGLYVAIWRLRQALSDGARSPTYIETVPRGGYRFVCPLEVLHPDALPGVTAAAKQDDDVLDGHTRSKASTALRSSEMPIESNLPSLGDQSHSRLKSQSSSSIVKEEMQVPLRPIRKPQRLGPSAVWAAGVFLLGLLLGLLAFLSTRTGSKMQVMASSRSVIPPPPSHDFRTVGINPAPITLSPDGSKMVFVAQSASEVPILRLRHMDTLIDDVLAGTEGASFPFWSPDGQALAFFADGKLKRLDLATGAISVVCNSWEGRGGSWNRDGVIIFAAGARSPILKVSAAGGAPTPVTTLDNAKYTTHRWPEFLSDGVHFLFFAANHEDASNFNAAVFIGSLTGEDMRFVVKADANASYAVGRLLFAVGDRLYQQPFDARRLALTGQPSLLAGDIEYDKGLWHTTFSATPDLLVYRKSPGTDQGGRRLAWFTRTGKLVRYIGKEGEYRGVAISTDAKTTALEYGDPDANIWLLEPTKDNMTRLTDRALDCCPVWSPDDQFIAVTTHSGFNRFGVALRSVDKLAPEVPIMQSNDQLGASAWSPDGRFLLLAKVESQRIALLAYDLRDHSTSAYLPLRAQNTHSVFSPDGHWVAFSDTETGTTNIYITSFPNPTRKYLVSTGGDWPVWRRDGRELFFLGNEQTLYSTPITPEGSQLKVGQPKPLFHSDIHLEGRPFDVDATGSMFLLVVNAPRKHSDIMLLTNWSH